MSDKRSTLVMMLRDEVSRTADKIQGKLAGVHKGAMGSVLTGVGLGVGVSAWNMVGRAIGGATDALFDAAQAAMAEEAQIGRLDQALRTNASGWDGNLDAVESLIDGRRRLAFTDDELRDSLIRLIPVTKDVDAAFDVQSTAMDVARLRGIDLASATDKVAKALVGNKRVLKELGIQLDSSASATEILTAIQATAAGQAERYADSSEAAAMRIGDAWEELKEDGGRAILGLADQAASGLGYVAYWWQTGAADIEEYAKHLIRVEAVAKNDYQTLVALGDSMSEVTAATREAQDPLRAYEDAAGDAGDETDDLADAATTARKELRKLEGAANDAMDALIEATLGPEQLKIKLEASKDELRANERALRDLSAVKNPTADQQDDIRDLKLKVSEGKEEVIRLTGRLVALGDITTDDLRTELKKLGVITGDTADEAERLVDAYRQIPGVDVRGGESPVEGSGRQGGGGRSSGGPVEAGRRYVVGEAGPELFVPQSDGFIVPNAGGGTPVTSAGPTGAPVVIQLNLDGREVARVVDQHLYFAASVAPVSAR